MAEYDFPTEVIGLPSEGKCYPSSNPLSSGQIEIKYYPVVTKTGEIERDEDTGEEQERIDIKANITAIIKIQKGKQNG